MVASIGTSTGGVARMADAIFTKLDTQKQGYIDKAGLQDGTLADDTFNALDGDSDGKVTKSEPAEALTKLSDQLNAQYDASRVAGPPPGGHGPRGPGGAGTGSSDGTSETATTYNAAADTDGNGKVSAEEAAAYAKQQASGMATGDSSAGNGISVAA